MSQGIGQVDLIDIPTPASYTPTRGLVRAVSKRVLNGSVEAYTAGLAASGYSWELSPEVGTPYTVVTTVAAPDLTTTWELDGNDVEVSIFTKDRVRDALNQLGDDIDGRAQQAEFRTRIEALVRGDYPTAGGNASTTNATTALRAIVNDFVGAVTGTEGLPSGIESWDEFFAQLVGDMIDGVEAVPVSAFVLRRRSILPPITDVSPGYDGVGKAYSTARLLVEEPTIPANIREALPAGYWAKKTPTATQNTDATWAYVVEYWWAQKVSKLVYEVEE